MGHFFKFQFFSMFHIFCNKQIDLNASLKNVLAHILLMYSTCL